MARLRTRTIAAGRLNRRLRLPQAQPPAVGSTTAQKIDDGAAVTASG